MSYKTIGIDIGVEAIRYVLCQTELKSAITQSGAIAIDQSDPEGINVALGKLASSLVKLKKEQIDAIGLTVDPTVVLSTHRIFDFNDPALIANILPASVMDIWKNDGTAQLAFEVGEYIDRSEESEGEGDELNKGYDVRVINYPYIDLCDVLSRLKRVQIDPHVVIPANEALSYALPSLLDVKDSDVYVILDIGARKTMLAVCEGREVKLARALKVGSNSLDSSIADAFNVSPEEARALKERSGFVAIPGAEQSVYTRCVQSGQIAEIEGDPMAMAQACTRGLGVLFQGIRQTLMNYMSQKHPEPTHVYLTGGGSKLAGFADWLSQYMGVQCALGLPMGMWTNATQDEAVTLDACAAALAAAANIEGKCPMNLRRGRLAHKGSLAFIQENKWILMACAVALIAAVAFMLITQAKTAQEEHDRLKASLEETTQAVLGKKLLNYNQIQKEFESSQNYDFIPERTAFTHLMWLSNNINDLSDVEMDLNSLEIDIQRKIVKIRGEVSGDDGLPRFMQLLEQYECFPKNIKEPKTSKIKDRTSFTLSVDANNCPTGGSND